MSMSFAEIANLQVGDRFEETEYGMSVRCRVVSPIEQSVVNGRRKLEWRAQDVITGRVIDYLRTEGFDAYSSDLHLITEADNA